MRGCCTKEEVNVESVFEKQRLLTRLLQPRSRLRNIINMQIMPVSYTSVIHGYINQVFIAHFSFSSRWEWPQAAAPALHTGQWSHHTRKHLRIDFTIYDHGHYENKFQEPTAKTIVHFFKEQKLVLYFRPGTTSILCQRRFRQRREQITQWHLFA